ncbi:MAG: ATP-dependent dethiobiotin synthetase BioD [Alphaproteobacteria bacterium]|nr:ATP-dependent dethiobiotin synthetase BioD [Alphaproteobacteria bacterium]
MMKTLIVTGTDTGVGKTVVAAMLVLAFDALYWKPIQSGLADGTDTDTVATLTGISGARQLPEAYRLHEPLSPHRAAELDGVTIDTAALALPETPSGRWLIVEGAGGVLVPVTRSLLQIELFARWQAPVLVVARTALGTINHTLLTVEALRRREIPVQGIVFVGDENSDTQRTIAEFSGVEILGRVPMMDTINPDALRDVFQRQFRRGDFESFAPADAGALDGRVKPGHDKLLR